MVRLYYSLDYDYEGNEIISKISLTPIKKDCRIVDLVENEIIDVDDLTTDPFSGNIMSKPYNGKAYINWGYYDPETHIFGDSETEEFYDENGEMYDRIYECRKYQNYKNGEPIGEPYFEEA